MDAIRNNCLRGIPLNSRSDTGCPGWLSSGVPATGYSMFPSLDQTGFQERQLPAGRGYNQQPLRFDPEFPEWKTHNLSADRSGGSGLTAGGWIVLHFLN